MRINFNLDTPIIIQFAERSEDQITVRDIIIMGKFLQRRNMNMMLRSGRTYARAMGGAALAGRITRRVANRVANSYTQTTNRRRFVRAGQGVTTQHDRRIVYSKKSMPFRQKKRWKSFKRKVNAIAEKELGSRTALFNLGFDDNNIIPGNHSQLTFALYPQESTLSRLNDLANIVASENVGNPTEAAGITIESSTKFIFQSGILDLTIKNASTRVVSIDPLQLEGFGKLELDVYEMTMSRYASTESATFSFMAQVLNTNIVDTKGIGGSTNEIDINFRGATPWDMTYALGRFGIKILKKTKFFIPNGDTITYQIRDPRRHVVTRKGILDDGGFNKPGLTRILFIIYKVVPGSVIGPTTTVGNVQEAISVGCTRKYLYKLEGANDDRTRYFSNT